MDNWERSKQEFIEKWNIDAIENMTLEQYTNLDRESSFTYWLESKTDDVLGIWGGSAYKFGIFKRKNTEHITYEKGRTGDNQYSWYSKYGENRDKAFKNIKKLIVEIAESAVNSQFEKIDDIDLGGAIKWKIAFMYAPRGALLRIASNKAFKFLAKKYNIKSKNIAEIHQELISQKPLGEDFYTYSDRLFQEFKGIQEPQDIYEDDDFEPEENRVYSNQGVNKLNQILFGPPGTGKTYNTINHALKIIAERDGDLASELERNSGNREFLQLKFKEFTDNQQIKIVTFHQSYGYEDFIEGIRAITDDSGNIHYQIKDGVLKKVCKLCISSNNNRNYVLIIDEINRGNISKIFGELITLIEPSKRIGESDEIILELPYSEEAFGVPNNLYIIGTMNTADRSIALMDTALRRRFDFVEMMPKPELLKGKCSDLNLEKMLITINKRIEYLYDREHMIGHAYFMHLGQESSTEDVKDILINKIIPLLQEYFYDDWEKIRLVLGDNNNENEIILKEKIEGIFYSSFDEVQEDKYSYKINNHNEIIKILEERWPR